MTKKLMIIIGAMLIISSLAAPYANGSELASFMSIGPTASLIWGFVGFIMLVYAVVPMVRNLIVRFGLACIAICVLAVGMIATWRNSMLVIDSFLCAISSIFMLTGSLELSGKQASKSTAIEQPNAKNKVPTPKLATAKH